MLVVQSRQVHAMFRTRPRHAVRKHVARRARRLEIIRARRIRLRADDTCHVHRRAASQGRRKTRIAMLRLRRAHRAPIHLPARDAACRGLQVRSSRRRVITRRLATQDARTAATAADRTRTADTGNVQPMIRRGAAVVPTDTTLRHRIARVAIMATPAEASTEALMAEAEVHTVEGTADVA